MNRRTTAFLGAVAGLALTLLGASPAAAVATLPATDTIYMVACGLGYNDLSLFSIAPDGTATPIGTGDGNTNGKCAKGATWDAKNQKAYFLSEDNVTSTLELWTMDVESGTPTKVSDIVGGSGFYIHFDSEGAAQTQYDGTFYNLNTTSYTETEIPSSSVNGDNGVYYLVQAFNYADNSLYVINADDTEDDSPPVDNMVYKVDPTTGIVWGQTGPDVSGLPNENYIGRMTSMAFDSAGTGWAIFEEDLYSFDVATGVFTLQGPISDGDGFPSGEYSLFIAQPVPALPSTGYDAAELLAFGLMLAFAGTGTLVVMRRRTVV